MSDMLQLVVKIKNTQFRSDLSAINLDDKLKHVGHLLDAFLSAGVQGD
jgi:hypothetical protein